MFARFGKADFTSLVTSFVALIAGFVANVPPPWDTVLVLVAVGGAAGFGLLGSTGHDLIARLREFVGSDEFAERIAERVSARLNATAASAQQVVAPAFATLLLVASLVGIAGTLGACGGQVITGIPEAYDSATLRVTPVDSDEVLGEITLDLNEQPELRGGICFEVAVTDADLTIYKQCIEGAYPSSALQPDPSGDALALYAPTVETWECSPDTGQCIPIDASGAPDADVDAAEPDDDEPDGSGASACDTADACASLRPRPGPTKSDDAPLAPQPDSDDAQRVAAVFARADVVDSTRVEGTSHVCGP